jgi:Tol biopolymer transport system component
LTPRIFAPGIISSQENFEFKITFSPDRKEIYFTRGIGIGKTERQIMYTKLFDSGWTEPAIVSFSGDYMDEYPSISPDGEKLFFNSNRPLPVSWNRKAASYIFNLWIVEKISGGWGEPYPINQEANRGYCINYIDKQGSIFFNNADFSKIAKSTYNNESFSEPIELETPFKSTECYFSPDNSYVIFSSGYQSFGKLDLYVSFLENDSIWGKPIHLGKNINSSESESAPVISPDGKYLFYNSDGEIYWVSAKIIDEFRLNNRDQ